MLLRPVVTYKLALLVALSAGGDPRTALKNVQDAILDKLHAARPNDQKDLVQPQICPSETNEFVQDAFSFISPYYRETSALRRRRGTAQKRAANEDAANPRPKRTRMRVCRDS